MNRLWVWISLLVVCVVMTVALFPYVSRVIAKRTGTAPFQEERIPPVERDPEMRARIEERLWNNLYRTIAVGAAIGLIAGIALTRWLVAPLRGLESGARAIARQQWDHRVPEKGSTEMRSVASAFNQMAEELERQASLRRNMLADVTHELRHPVHTLQGGLLAILDGVYPLSMQEIDRMLEQTHNLTGLVDDLHELALAEAHELPLDKSAADLGALTAQVCEIYQPLAADKGVTLKTELPNERITSLVDPARIRQVLQNILSNALRCTPQGGQIRVGLSSSADFGTIYVEDTGIGIEPDNLERVFDRFYRHDSSRSRELPGTGLGLAIAKAIIEAHGGDIQVESAGIDQGSKFTIRLPSHPPKPELAE